MAAGIKITGPSDSGKTTLIEKLVSALAAHGLRVGTVKHAHKGFHMDREGKDSWRHVSAGSTVTALVGPENAVWIAQTDGELTAEQAIERMLPVDIVLVEGYKQADMPEIVLAAGGQESVEVDGDRCLLSLFPGELSSQEVEQVVAFCIESTGLGLK